MVSGLLSVPALPVCALEEPSCIYIQFEVHRRIVIILQVGMLGAMYSERSIAHCLLQIRTRRTTNVHERARLAPCAVYLY